jgi:hypothetical protein
VAFSQWTVRFAFVFLSAGVCFGDGPQFSTFLGGKWGEFAAAVTTDAQGSIYIAGQTGSPDFPVTPGAAQTVFGGGSDVFVAKLAPDGTLVWCTYFGGSGGEGARGIGADRDGNVIVAGMTGSQDLPVVNAMQKSLDNGHLRYGADAFVLKLDPTGSKVLYATYLGGDGSDWAWALAVDPAGNAYVAGDTGPVDYFPGPNGTTTTLANFNGGFVTKLDPSGAVVYTYFLPNVTPRGIAVDATGSAYLTGLAPSNASVSLGGTAAESFGSGDVFAGKLAPDGSGLIYQTTFGGSLTDIGTAIAVDSTGSAYITGLTYSADFPTVNPLQATMGARSLFKSTDNGTTWAALEDPPFGALAVLAVDPAASGALYAAAVDGGVFKSTNGGATWAGAGNGIEPSRVQALAMDPSNRGVLYAGGTGGMYKSTDGAANWTLLTRGTDVGSVFLLAIDPKDRKSVV